jgi:hypothetical protein
VRAVNGNRSLPGERDNFSGGAQSAVQTALQNVSGLKCTAGAYAA